MSLLLYLYLVHFLADYSLQPSKLVAYKKENFLGVVIHSTVHLVTLLIVLAPFLPNNRIWAIIGVIYVTHIAIDQVKISLSKVYPDYIRFLYFLDQIVHMIIVTACAWYVGAVVPHQLSGALFQVYSNQFLVAYLLALVLATYVFDVTRYFVKKGFKKKPFKRDWPGMIRNAGLVSLFFLICWVCQVVFY